MKSLILGVAACAAAMAASAEEWTPKFYEGLEANGTVRTVADGYQGKDECLELRHVSGGRKFGAEKAVESGLTGPVDWTVTADVRCADGGEAQVGMEFYNAAGKLVATKLGATVRDADWTKRTWTFHARANVAKAKVQLLTLSGGTVCFAHVAAKAASGADTELAMDVRCYPVSASLDWNGKAVFNTFADAPLPLTFHFSGDRSLLKDPAFEIDLPAGYAVTDAFTYHCDCHRAEVPRVTDVRRDGRDYRRFRFTDTNVFRILQTGFGWGRKLVVVIEPERDVRIPSKIPVYYRVADATRTGDEQTFEMSFTRLPTQFRKPKDFRVHSWEDGDRNLTKDDVLARTARAYEAAGCTSLNRPSPKFKRGQEVVRQLKARGTGWFFPHGFPDLWYERFNGGDEYRKLAVRKVKKIDGSTMDGKICPDYFNNDPAFRAYYERRLAGSLKDVGMEDGDWITLDFEPWQSSEYCMCDVCLKKFAAFAGLAEPPPVKELADKSKYLDKWAQFRCGQCEDTIRITSEIVHKFNPKLVVCDYDYIQFFGTGTEHLFYRGCAKDTRRNETWFDRHCCSYYHVHDKKAFEAIRNNTRTLKKPYIPVASNDGSGSYLSKAEVRHPRQLRQLALAAFVHGCPGFSFYSGAHFDGAQLFAMMKARDEIAALEDLPWGKTEGALKAEASDDQLVFATTAKDGRELIALFNYNRKAPVTALVKSDALRTGHALVDPVSGEKLADHADLRKGFEVSVPKDGVKFLELRAN